MTIVLAILSAACLAILIFVLLQNRKLELAAAAANQEAERQRKHYEAETARVYNEAQASVAEAQRVSDQQTAELKQESERVRQHYEAETACVHSAAQAAVAEAQKEAERHRQHCEAETARIYNEAQAAVAEAQKLIDAQSTGLTQESERVRLHYEAEARKVQEAADERVAKNMAEVDSLRKHGRLRDAEAETQRQLSEAIKEATALRDQAEALMAQAREAAANDRLAAKEEADDIHEQADARLNQAIRDAGRIIARAEERAEKIAGEDAYRALREKDTLAAAAEAIRNTIEKDYGDRYVVPTYSFLDDLAAEFSRTAAGQSLASARAQSKRMVEQGQAAACDYVEANRRGTAIRFVIDAFNGRVDSILSRVKKKNQNPGTLKQEILEAFSKVNLNGQAFKNAQILQLYLDARLDELKWAVVVQELDRKWQEEQRGRREEIREAEKRRRAEEENIRKTQKEEEMKRAARDETCREHEREMKELVAKMERASEEEKAELRKQMDEKDAKHAAEMKEKDEEIRLAEEQHKRAISNAERGVKHGHVYIISNIGSFDEDVLKIGQTVRDDWDVRVDELGDASVPFKFDVHGIVESDDAPGLERKVHRMFMDRQVNKDNPRKEFFRVSLDEVRQAFQTLKEQGEVFTMKKDWIEIKKAPAEQYKYSLRIEGDPQEMERWRKDQEKRAARLEREWRIANRREQGALALSDSDGLETEADEQGTSEPQPHPQH